MPSFRTGNQIQNKLITILFAAQPCLDVLAFWTRNEKATPAGYIRLLLLILLPLIALITAKNKKHLLSIYLITGLFCSMHILNSFRVGYINPVFDIRYLASVVQMPIFTVCFFSFIRNDDTKNAALTGVRIAAVLTLIFFVLAWITNTGNVTYGEGLGYSGWVIDENRNANSTIFVIFGCFCIYFALKNRNLKHLTAVACLVTVIFLSNGTKGCYFSIFVIFLLYTVYLLYEKFVLGKEFQRTAVIIFLLLSVLSAVIYPWTPRYKVTEAQRQTARGTQGEIEATLLEKGIDITDMSPQERFDNPIVKEVFVHYYWKYLGVKPDLIDRFSMDRVLMQYRMSTNVSKLIDARIMERNYADMIFQDSDFLTKAVGFEASEIGFDGIYDLENDWHAIFYYYGYLGFALYLGFLFAVLYNVIIVLFKKLRGRADLELFAYMLVLALILGLAHFSGATLRRPNVSIWLSLVLALLLYYSEAHKNEAQYHSSSL